MILPTSCLACGGELYKGKGAMPAADDFICRECQRSPAVQVRVHLSRARLFGMPFDRAWDWSLERVRWPHDKEHRNDWKWVFEQEKVKLAFERTYAGGPAERKMAVLAELHVAA
jgi:hypothetical protein